MLSGKVIRQRKLNGDFLRVHEIVTSHVDTPVFIIIFGMWVTIYINDGEVLSVIINKKKFPVKQIENYLLPNPKGEITYAFETKLPDGFVFDESDPQFSISLEFFK